MGTRGSVLALAQSGQVAAELSSRVQGLEVETVRIKTSGDLFADKSPQAHAPPSGGKGLFVKEIEEALRRGEIDFAVHSAKDLPAELAPGLMIGAYPAREDPRDVYIGRDGRAWNDRSGRIATSSLRRAMQAGKPGVEIVPMRGNVDTRLRKLSEGFCDGLILALAGLRRLGRAAIPHEPLSPEAMTPAPGQGALAIEARADRRDVLDVLSKFDDASCRREVELERAFMKEMGGGCAIPLGALARVEPGGVSLRTFYADPAGRAGRRDLRRLADGADPRGFVRGVARTLRG